MVKKQGNDKGKGKVTDGADEKSRRPKHEWSKEDVELLIQLLVEEAQIQLGRGGSLVGFQHRWVNVTEKFNDRRSGQGYVDRHQCKNKGDTLKSGWRKWKELTNKQTGLGWNEDGNCYTYPEDWIARKAQENRGIHKLVNSKWPAYLVDQMELIWGQAYANGELRLTPGGVAPQELEDSANVAEDDEVQVLQGHGTTQSMRSSERYNHSGSGYGGGSMDISAGMGYAASYGAVGSNNKRVHAPFLDMEDEDGTPIFDMQTAASVGASMAASAFQGSPFAGIVAGSSNNYQPDISLSLDHGNTIIRVDDVPLAGDIQNQCMTEYGNVHKPAKWDELMETTADGVVHGARKKPLQPKKDTSMGKKKSKGSRGNNASEKLEAMEGRLDETLDDCRTVLYGLQSEKEKEDGVISLQDAADIVRAVEGIPRSELTYVLMLL